MISGDVIYTAKWAPLPTPSPSAAVWGRPGAMDSISATYDQEVTLPKNTLYPPPATTSTAGASSGASSGSYADEKPVKNLTTKRGRRSRLRRLVRPAGECDPAPEL